MQFHPAANSFPMMDKKRLAELVADIKQRGQQVKIVLADGMVLDGRNRWRACERLGIQPQTTTFTGGNPWDYVWSMNGERRDLESDDQRYLIWKHCNEHGTEWQAEQERIREEANRKRSEAAKVQPRTPDGARLAPKPEVPRTPPPAQPTGQVRVQTVPAPVRQSEHPDRKAKAAAAKVNTGAVARGDALAKRDPMLAEKVRLGEIKPSDAHRQVKRQEVVAKLEAIEVKQAKTLQGVFDVIVIDPPWPMEKIERDCRPNQVALDYPTMTEEQLRGLALPMATDCHVWVWTTHRFLPMAFRLLDCWSLKYCCAFTWHKPGGFQPVGLPQFNCEFALYARRGSPMFIDTKAFNVCFEAPRGKHSEKPEEFYAILRRVTAGRRIDMFNRRVIDGFEGWGKESTK